MIMIYLRHIFFISEFGNVIVKLIIYKIKRIGPDWPLGIPKLTRIFSEYLLLTWTLWYLSVNHDLIQIWSQSTDSYHDLSWTVFQNVSWGGWPLPPLKKECVCWPNSKFDLKGTLFLTGAWNIQCSSDVLARCRLLGGEQLQWPIIQLVAVPLLPAPATVNPAGVASSHFHWPRPSGPIIATIDVWHKEIVIPVRGELLSVK